MNTLARLTGGVARLWARVILRWAETRYGAHAVRLFVYSNIVASSDEPALFGRAGNRRGHHQTQPADPQKARDFWQRCAGEWVLRELARRRGIVLDSWKLARPERRPFSRHTGRR